MSFEFNPLTKKGFDKVVSVDFTGVITYKGAYNASTDYAVGDSVDYNGSSYVMFNDAAAGTAPTDTTYWQVLANKGATGAAGADGPNNITTSTTTNLTGFLKGNGSVVSADNSTYLTAETDPVFSASEAASFAAGDAAKLAGIAAGAEVNVQADWNQANNTADDYIKNKPTIPAAQVNSDWNASGTVAEILNKPSIPTQYTDALAVSAIKADAAWHATNWDTAYGWGNHASGGYQTTANLVSTFQATPDDTHYASEKLVKDSLDGKAATGHNHTGVYQPAGTYSTDIHSNITALNAVSGTNTGDQDLSSYLTSSTAASTYEPIISSKGTAFNKNFGSGATDVAAGNHNHTGVYDAAGTATSAVSAHAGTNTHAQIDTFIGTTVPNTYAPLVSPSFTTPTLGVATATRLGIGAAADAVITLYDYFTSLAAAPKFEYFRTGITNSIGTGFKFLASTDGDMVDGFGPAFSMYIKDSAGVENALGSYAAIRDGADNTGKLVLRTTLAGTTTSRVGLTSTDLSPIANDGITLGTTALQWSDLFLAEGGVINWDNGDVTLTQKGNELAVAGGIFSAPSGISANSPETPTSGRIYASSLIGVFTDNSGFAQGSFRTWHDTQATYGSSFNFYRYRGTYASPTVVQVGDYLGRIGSYTYDSGGSVSRLTADIRFEIDSALTASTAPTKIVFQTTGTDRLTIASNGAITSTGATQLPSLGIGMAPSGNTGVLFDSLIATGITSANINNRITDETVNNVVGFRALVGTATSSNSNTLGNTRWTITQADPSALKSKFEITVNTGDSVLTGLTINDDLSVAIPSNLAVDTSTLFVNSSTNRVGVGTATPTTVFDLLSHNFYVGADTAAATTRTANTNKLGVVGVPHYATSNGGAEEEAIAAILTSNTTSANTVVIGGGSASYNAATSVQIWTGATNTTTGGTKRFEIDAAGLTTLAGSLQVNGGNLLMQSTTADTTAKYSYLRSLHYDTDEEDILLYYSASVSGANNVYFGGGVGTYNSASEIRFYTGATSTTLTGSIRLTLDNNGNVVCGAAAIATNATDGFLYIPSCAGTPTGTPTAKTGRVAMVFDTTNNKLYVYDGGWIDVT